MFIYAVAFVGVVLTVTLGATPMLVDELRLVVRRSDALAITLGNIAVAIAVYILWEHSSTVLSLIFAIVFWIVLLYISATKLLDIGSPPPCVSKGEAKARMGGIAILMGMVVYMVAA